MNEEQKLILKMVEEGKITADEAAALLEAVGQDEPKTASPDDENDVWEKLSKQGDEFAHKVEHAADRFSKSLEAKLEGGMAERLSSLPKLLSKIPFVLGAEQHEFTQEFSGTFAADADALPVRLSTTNGRIEVNGWEQDHYKLTVIQRVRGKDRDTARGRMIEIPLAEGAADARDLVLAPETSSEVTISYQLFLPKKNPYEIVLTTSNGRIQTAYVNARSVVVDTTNGGIELRQIRAGSVEARTNNGSNVLDYVEAETIKQESGNGSLRQAALARETYCRTTNGSVKVSPLGILPQNSTMQLITTNGSVRCSLPRAANTGCSVEAVTAVGNVTVDIDGFESIQERSASSKRVVGRTIGYEDAPSRLAINARTSSGSVVVSQDKEGEHGAK